MGISAMSINKDQLRALIIRPTLQYLNLWSEAAENLLMGTAAQESQLGTYIHQLGNGPALGIYQMEPNTYDDIYINYLSFKYELGTKVGNLLVGLPFHRNDSEEVVGNLYYATAMCRIHYLRIPHPLPDADDLPGLAAYYKKYYNTPLGAATEQQFIDNYKKYVA